VVICDRVVGASRILATGALATIISLGNRVETGQQRPSVGFVLGQGTPDPFGCPKPGRHEPEHAEVGHGLALTLVQPGVHLGQLVFGDLEQELRRLAADLIAERAGLAPYLAEHQGMRPALAQADVVLVSRQDPVGKQDTAGSRGA
jgi:hypothetical protein